MKHTGWIGLSVALVAVAGGAAFLLKGDQAEVKFRTAVADKGNISQRISATGVINALIQVPVGTQVSGVVTALYADFNSLVKKGQVIAQIDATPWITNLKDAEAGLQRAQAALANGKSDYRRNKLLWDAKLLADADLDAKDLALKTATAQLESAQAAVTKARTNLGYCTLKAPVDGVVVSRVVDVGQTVAASFSTPNVFTIAQDLSKMKVSAAIDEADIGQVRVGQRAFFTVDSYPDKQFQGVVSEVQLNPVINQNVVTYNVIMEVTNEPRDGAGAERGRGAGRRDPVKAAEGMGMAQVATLESNTARYIPVGSPVYKGNLALFPGMTANCTIVTQQRQDTLRVPAVALRFNPAAFLKATDKKATPGPAMGQGGQRQGGASAARGMVAKREDRVWVLENGKPKAMVVKAGVSDGQFTEISGDGVVEGLVVLTGIDDSSKKAAAAKAGAANHAAPPMGGGRR